MAQVLLLRNQEREFWVAQAFHPVLTQAKARDFQSIPKVT